ncbi:MAG: hypothetical protein H0T44_13590 [Gemmatimonadales bacterium]|nr:hypothetical protein [Gemmatimonadales bacterium]MBA3556517.1 hypothetical protein [Gemmatimonadales bacterium]
MMTQEALGTYLNDHLAGSITAVEVLERAIESSEGSPLQSFLSELLEAIEDDQDLLRHLLKRIGVAESPLKKAGAWLAEKAGRPKLRDSGNPAAIGRLEMLEMLATGIYGKLALWRSLEVAASRHPELGDLDFEGLQRRAKEQHDSVEIHRLAAAREAL